MKIFCNLIINNLSLTNFCKDVVTLKNIQLKNLNYVLFISEYFPNYDTVKRDFTFEFEKGSYFKFKKEGCHFKFYECYKYEKFFVI